MARKQGFAVLVDGVPDWAATAQRLIDLGAEIRAELEPLPGFPRYVVTTDEDGKEKGSLSGDPIILPSETVASIREGLVYPMKAFQAARGGGPGAGRQLNVDLSRLQTVYSDARRDHNNLYQSNKSTFYNVVANKFNANESDFAKWTDPQKIARYVKDLKINDVSTPSVTEHVTS